MRSLGFVVGLALVAAASACSTVQTRIQRNQARFDSYPPDIQKEIRRGQVDVGFSREQVEMALGRPDRVERRGGAAGAEQEVWVYATVVTPNFGADSGWLGEPPPAGTVAVGAFPERIDDEGRRVVLQGGTVVAVEIDPTTAMSGDYP
ncbi:MAG: hypothetical protein ACHQ49_09685 [Elusimicrobiota bacterium]